MFQPLSLNREIVAAPVCSAHWHWEQLSVGVAPCRHLLLLLKVTRFLQWVRTGVGVGREGGGRRSGGDSAAAAAAAASSAAHCSHIQRLVVCRQTNWEGLYYCGALSGLLLVWLCSLGHSCADWGDTAKEALHNKVHAFSREMSL